MATIQYKLLQMLEASNSKLVTKYDSILTLNPSDYDEELVLEIDNFISEQIGSSELDKDMKKIVEEYLKYHTFMATEEQLLMMLKKFRAYAYKLRDVQTGMSTNQLLRYSSLLYALGTDVNDKVLSYVQSKLSGNLDELHKILLTHLLPQFQNTDPILYDLVMQILANKITK